MSDPPADPLGAAMRLGADVEAAAAVGALLRIRTEGLEVPADLVTHLEAVAAAVGVDVDALDESQQVMAAGAIRSLFLQAGDLLGDPARPPGWGSDDPALLQATGRLSMAVAGVIGRLVPGLDGLGARLAAGGRILDVGSGVGWLAVALARAFPAAEVLGLDVHPPALALAVANGEQEGLGERVRFREQSVADLDEDGAYDLAWFAAPFIPAPVVPVGLARVAAALAPGGWIVFGTFGDPPDPRARALAHLRTVRAGGHPWSAEEASTLLADVGLVDVQAPDAAWQAPLGVVVGRRPPG